MKYFLRLVLVLAGTLLLASVSIGQTVDMSLFKGMKPRSIGPAGMSGRVTAIAVNPTNPDHIFVGSASGGLWESKGGGVNWTPIFDEVPAAAIGAIAIHPNNPHVLYVGTGEGNPRNSQNSGNGIYKSIDGGKTWTHLGLEATRTIDEIIIHRHNPSVVYVSAMGSAWGDTPDRGVYRSTDAGKTWKKILYVNPRTGAANLVADPQNPDKMFVNMWEYRRWPWFFKSGGPGSGLYVTLDGGDTWTKRTHKDGLPEGELGKIGLAIAPSRPNVVYALVEARKNALYRSDDGGYTFRKVADENIGGRPFYYADIYVDPKNENRLYNIHTYVDLSEDGGKTFSRLLGWNPIHVDHHAFFIHPDNPDYLIDGNDGGLAISRDRGKTWRFIENLPLAQFYHIQIDNQTPYNVYGGMQDNGTWKGPSQVWREGGIRNAYWEEIGFGDGFDVVVERDNTRYGYVMWQGGNLMRTDFLTGAQEWVKPTAPDSISLRFNWNAAIAQGVIDPNTLYYGSQYLHRSTDAGKSWEIISPDLTTNDPAKLKQIQSGGLTYDVTSAENHCTIICISPSPRSREVIWVGTDDGNIQVTADGGQTWTNTSRFLAGLPKGAWVAQIHASRFSPSEAFVVVNNYRQNDWNPYLFRTRDLGNTWESLVTENQVQGHCLSWVQDIYEPKLQFLGTEYGLYVSIDEGNSWTKWTNGFPSVPTIDMVIHPREHDLVIGTFGRAAWVLDDIRPLRALTQLGADIFDNPVFVFPAPDAYQAHYKQAAGTRFAGDAHFQGENRPYGTLLSFYLKDIAKKDADKDTVQVEVFNTTGKLVRTLHVAAEKGVNRISWELDHDGVRWPGFEKPKDNAQAPSGRSALPGEYKVRVRYGEHIDSVRVTVRADPRINPDTRELVSFYRYWDEFDTYIEATTESIDKLKEAKKTVSTLRNYVSEQVQNDSIKTLSLERIKRVETLIDTLIGKVLPPEDIQGIYRNPELLTSKIWAAQVFFNVSNPATRGPSENHRTAVEACKNDVLNYVMEVNQFFSNQYVVFKRQMDALRLDLVQPVKPINLR
jgi:photosystem II stability/assembly factor-like uncharacterized protein